jgi:exonuclease SbcC
LTVIRCPLFVVRSSFLVHHSSFIIPHSYFIIPRSSFIIKKNMLLSTLRLRNYKQYAALDLEFREGLVGVIGKNGAGKSTIFEAILYCLFGRDEGNKAHVRSVFADGKSPVELELSFSLGEALYRVRRDFRGKALTVGAELFKNDTLIAKGVSAVNEELVRLLQLERDAFKRSVFSGQKELSELSDTTGEARKRMVRRMLGLDTLDEAQMRVNADVRELNSRVAGQQQNLLDAADVQALTDGIAQKKLDLQRLQADFSTENTQLQALRTQHQALKQRFDAEEARLGQFNQMNKATGELRERRSGLLEQQARLNGKMAELQAQQAQLEAQRPVFVAFLAQKKRLLQLEELRQKQINLDAVHGRMADLREQLGHSRQQGSALDAQLADKATVEQALLGKQQAIAELEAQLEAKRGDLRRMEQNIGGLQAGIAERRDKVAQLRDLGRAGQCPTCLQPLLEGYDRALQELQTQIDALQTQALQGLEQEKNAITEAGKSMRGQLETLRHEADQLRGTQARLQEIARQHQGELATQQRLQANLTRDELILREIGPVQFDETAYQHLKNVVGAAEPGYLDWQKSENYVAREWPNAQQALRDTAQNLSATDTALAQKLSEQEALNFQETAYLEAKTALTGFSDVLSEQTEKVNALERSASALRNDIARAEEKLADNARIQAQISDKLQEMELLRKLADMLGLFKTEILEKISPSISREASQLFSRITKGRYESILVDENFDFSIADGGVFYPIERFSGGEVDLANFCLRIAITKAIMELSGGSQQLEFLAFDEIFGSQDEERRLEMMLALNYLQEQFRQIYIVSHIDSLKDFFPHLLEVQSRPEGSMALWR